MDKKIRIYLDCDDTIINSSETVIKILNKRYNKNCTIDDLKDWNYRSIVPTISKSDVEAIYSSEEFWNQVSLVPEFVEVFEEFYDDFEWVIISKGGIENIKRKKDFLRKNLKKNVKFGAAYHYSDSHKEEKTKFDMKNAIQIDDVFAELKKTNAAVKVLLKNDRNLYWNKAIVEVEGLYQLNNWNDIKDMLRFFKEHGELVAL